MIDDVIALGWPVGLVLGSEPDLVAKYGVSRAVLREAVGLLEHLQVAQTRRGPRGGVIVTEPTVHAVIDATVFYLHRLDVHLDEVFEARIVLEELVCELAAERFDEQDIEDLRALVGREAGAVYGDPRSVHVRLATVSRNPALELFVDVLNRVALLYSQDWRELTGETSDVVSHAHRRIVDAILGADAGLAKRRMRKHLEAEAAFLRDRSSTLALLPDTSVLRGRVTRRSETVARSIARQVVVDRLPPGTLLAAEGDLLEQHGVSRSVMREAVRILEHHSIARMRRGPGGGLFVVEPSPGALSDVTALYLARRAMRPADLAEVRLGVELALVDLAIDRCDDDDLPGLEAALQRESDASPEERVDAGDDLHGVLARLSHNRVLELVGLVLIRLSRLHQNERLAADVLERIHDEAHRAHEGIARAVQSRDHDLARHRLRRHLQALATLTM